MLWVIGEEESGLILKPEKIQNAVPKQWEELLEVIQESNIEILKHFSNGMQAKEIAPLVFMSERTVEGRIYKMRKIFNCRSLAHLIAVAFRLKLIE